NKIETSQIMEIMSRIPGWSRFQNPRRFKNYRRQKGWERVATSSDNQRFENDFVEINPKDIPPEKPKE
ncbi:MAG: hypothetical protein J5825_12215, partial [Lachnospiraceae bacterium]|nr:hypothetical protein [Lachnospiraceae bacterium]